MQTAILTNIVQLTKMSQGKLLKKRYQKFRRMGEGSGYSHEAMNREVEPVKNQRGCLDGHDSGGRNRSKSCAEKNSDFLAVYKRAISQYILDFCARTTATPTALRASRWRRFMVKVDRSGSRCSKVLHPQFLSLAGEGHDWLARRTVCRSVHCHP